MLNLFMMSPRIVTLIDQRPGMPHVHKKSGDGAADAERPANNRAGQNPVLLAADITRGGIAWGRRIPGCDDGAINETADAANARADQSIAQLMGFTHQINFRDLIFGNGSAQTI